MFFFHATRITRDMGIKDLKSFILISFILSYFIKPEIETLLHFREE